MFRGALVEILVGIHVTFAALCPFPLRGSSHHTLISEVPPIMCEEINLVKEGNWQLLLLSSKILKAWN